MLQVLQVRNETRWNDADGDMQVEAFRNTGSSIL